MSDKKPVINDVYVYYVKLKTPALQYQKNEVEGKPFANKEYVLDAIMKTADIEKFEKVYKKKGVKSLSEIKYVPKDQFEKRFKTAPPASDDYINEDGEYAVLKIRKSASYKDGSPIANPPAVVGFKSLGNKSKNGFLIEGRDTLIGNGSLVNIQIAERTYNVPNSTSKGMALDLFAIQVVDLVEYKQEGVGFDDAGDIVEESHDKDFDEDEEEGFSDAGEDIPEDSGDDEEWDA